MPPTSKRAPVSPCLICLKTAPNVNIDGKVTAGALYKRFLQFLSKHFKLRTISEKFLSCAKYVTDENTKQALFKVFCSDCQLHISKICDLYEQREILDMQLEWKLNHLGSNMENASKSISRKLESRLLMTLAEHLHVGKTSARSVKMLRDAFRLKCKMYRTQTEPKVAIHHGLSPASYLNKQRAPNNGNNVDTKGCSQNRKRKQNSFANNEPAARSQSQATLKNTNCQNDRKRGKRCHAVTDSACDMKVEKVDEDVSETNSDDNMKEAVNDICVKQEEIDSENTAVSENVNDDYERDRNDLASNDENPQLPTYVSDSCFEGADSPKSNASTDGAKQPRKRTRRLRKRNTLSILQYKESDEEEDKDYGTDEDWKCTSERNKEISSADSETETEATSTKRRSLKPQKKCRPPRGPSKPSRCSEAQEKKGGDAKAARRPYGNRIRMTKDKFLDNNTNENHQVTSNCGVCGHSKRADDLDEHLRTVHGGTYPCFTCEEKFETSKLLWAHLITHEIETDKYIACNICLRGFSTEQLRNLHNKFAHQNKTTYLCDDEKCVEVFDSLSAYNEHLKSHLEVVEDGSATEDERVFLCSTCGIGFLDERRRTLHEILHIPQSSGYKCPLCNYHNNCLHRFVLHYNNKHGVLIKSLRCKLCPERFTIGIMLGIHYKNKHGDSTEDMEIRNEWLKNKRTNIFEKQSERRKRGKLPASKLNSILLDPVSPPPFSEEMDLVRKEMPGDDSEVSVNIPPCPAEGCGKVLSSAYMLRKHLEADHENVEQALKKLACFHCSLWFVYEKSLELHILSAHRRIASRDIRPGKMKRFICDDLSCKVQPFSTVVELNDHLKWHLDEDALTEEGRNNPRDILYCSKCNWGFLRKDYMQLHELIHVPPENDGLFPCPANGCVEKCETVSLLRCHFSFTHIDAEKTLACVLCTQRFYTNRNLIEHTTRRHTVKEVESSSLSQEIKNLDRTERSNRKKRQLNGLKGRKLYDCSRPECKAFLDSPAALAYHQKKVHGQMLAFVCDECGDSFYSRGHLASHMASHGPAEYQCETCGKEFKRPQALERHIREIHNPKGQQEVCRFCGKMFLTLTGLKFHMAAVHVAESDWKWKCSTCNRKFYRKDLRRAHMKSCHGDDKNADADAAITL